MIAILAAVLNGLATAIALAVIGLAVRDRIKREMDLGPAIALIVVAIIVAAAAWT